MISQAKVLVVLSVSALFFACGSDNGTSNFDMDDSFEIVLSKGNYKYDSKDSSMKYLYSVCKESSLGSLVWKKDALDTVEGVAYLSKSTVTEIVEGDTSKFAFDGKSFPVGIWTGNEEGKIFTVSYDYAKGGSLEKLFRYQGSCFAKDLYSQLFKGNPAIASMEMGLAQFYSDFKPEGYELDSAEMLNDVRATDCDELTMYDGMVMVNIDYMRESSGAVKVTYGNSSCDVSFSYRYAESESDCKAAYEDFKEDENVDKFDFDNYSEYIEFDEYCVAELVLSMKKEQGIPLKKSQGESNEALLFARDIAGIFNFR